MRRANIHGRAPVTASVLQERGLWSDTAAVNTISLAFSSSVTAGSAIHAIGTGGNAAAIYSRTYSDGVNTYGNLDAVELSGANQQLDHGAAVNCAAGATTVTYAASITTQFYGIAIREIGGVTASPLDGHNIAATNGVTTLSVSATNSNQPALWSAVGTATNNGPPSASTGTQDGSFWLDAGLNFGTASHSRVTNTASQTAAFVPASGTDNLLSIIAIFDEAAGGGAIVGTAGMSFGQSGALRGAGALSGIGAIAFGETGALKGAGALAGSSAILFGQTGALAGSGVLAGTSTIVFGETGNLIGAGALTGSAGIAFDASGTLTPPSGSLSGTATLTFNQAGALTGAGALVGSAAIAFGQTGSLAGAGALAGSSGIIFNATGTLTPPGAMQGTAGLSFGQSGSLTGSAALSGEADFFFTASGTMIQPDVATATPGRRLRLRAQIRGETEEEKYARRIEQGIIVERFEALPPLAPKPIDRTIERLTSQVEAARAEVADYRALADRAQNRAKAKVAAAKLRRLDAALVAAQTQLIQAQTEEHDIVFVASVLANL